MDSRQPDNNYYNTMRIAEKVAEGKHRTVVGGLWDEIGQLQLDYLVEHGLKPHHFLLDVGCGALRGGVRFVGYLESGHYYGIDLNQSLLDAGYDKEIVPAGLANKLPRENLKCMEDFRVARAFGAKFHFAIAQSLFTHLRMNTIRDCLTKVARAVRPGGKFFATYWRVPEDYPETSYKQPRSGIITYPDKDYFHHKYSAMRNAAAALPWDVEDAGDWNHPRDQQMIVYHRRKLDGVAPGGARQGR